MAVEIDHDIAAVLDPAYFGEPATSSAPGSASGVAINVMVDRPDGSIALKGARLVQAAYSLLVAVADCPALGPGDLFALSDVTLEVQGVPVRDGLRSYWTIDARPA